MDQKRIHIRLEDLVEVEFTAKATGVTTIIRTKTRDISGGGVKVYLNQRLIPTSKMQLKITLPDSKKVISAAGEVVSSELIGVVGDIGEEKLFETRFKFANMDQKSKKEVIRYVYDCRKRKMNAAKKKQVK